MLYGKRAVCQGIIFLYLTDVAVMATWEYHPHRWNKFAYLWSLSIEYIQLLMLGPCNYASAFRRRKHHLFGLSVCPSVHPKPEIASFDLYMGPLVHPTNCDRFTACPSVHPERFPGICRRMHGGNSLKFYMLVYLDYLQNWLVYGHGLLIFLILVLFWLSETGQIWGFRAFPGERMERMACNFVRWCILITFRTD